jgi:hypothetical protein
MKPPPEDFREVAATMGRRALKEHYGVGQDIVTRWFREIGGNPRSDMQHTRKPVPEDFTALAPSMTAVALQKHYGVGERVVVRWLKETGATTSRTYEKPGSIRPVPDDFARLAPRMTQVQLREHYRVSKLVLRRWIAQAQVRTAGSIVNRRESRPVRQAFTPAFGPRPMVFKGHPGAAVKQDDLRLYTKYDEAADILRRERFVVFRCGPTGVFVEKGEHWRVGNVICTPDELLQRAEKYRRRVA